MNPSRRDAIATFLGTPALAGLSGCGHSDTPLPPGEIVGPSVGLGHRLRDGWRPVPTADSWESTDTVIIGGGVAGLGAAWRLSRHGESNYVLLELEPELGGTARGGTSAVGGYPWGAHYVPAPSAENQLLITLLEEMGVVVDQAVDGSPMIGEQYLCRDPQERIFYRGRWYEGLYLRTGESPEEADQFRRFQTDIASWAGRRDGRGRRAFAIPMSSGSDDPEITALDRITMAEWLGQHGFTSTRLRWYIDYACRDDYGLTVDQTSAWAGLFYFASRVKDAASEAEPLITWPEGNARLVRHLVSKSTGSIRTGCAVADVNPTATGVDVTAVSLDGRIRGLHAKRVIFAAPRFLARYLIRPYRDRPPPHLQSFEYGAWMVANLHLSDRPQPRGFPLCWDNVLYESPSLGYVVNTHQIGADHGPTIFTYYYPLTDSDAKSARARLLSTDRDAWAEVVLADLTMAQPEIRKLTTRLDVMRWGHAMIRPTPGFIWGNERRRAAVPFRNIHFAGADLSGVPLFEEAFYHGVRAAEELLTAADLKFDSLLGRAAG